MSDAVPARADRSADAESPPYPQHWEADVVLRDGVPMHIRPIRPQDMDALQDMHLAQSERSQYFRFFAPMARLSDRDLHRFTNVDHVERVALVLISGDRVLAVGRYDELGDGEAEVAFYVSDSEHGRGLGSVLLEHLAAAARERGLRRFVAEVLPGNTAMTRVLRDAGYEVSQVFSDGVVRVELDLALTGRSWAVMAEREQHAESLSMRALLGAGSVVVAGLGGRQAVLARRAGDVLAGGGFTGTLELVGTGEGGHRTLDELFARRRADDAPGIALAVVAGDPEEVIAAVPVLHELGVHGLVVLSGGFAEAGELGSERQDRLVRATRSAGMRLLGPASFGLVAAGPGGRLAATLRHDLPAGAVGLFCQSAAAGATLVDAAVARGIGLRSLVSAGNRADVSGNDTMQSWQDDDEVRVAALNLESIGNPRKFSRIVRRLATSRPVVVLVSGQTGQITPPGHPVRTSRQPQRVLAQMLDQVGAVRAKDLEHFLDLTQLFASQPMPRGERVAVLSASGTLTSMVAAEAREHGLEAVALPPLQPLAGAADYRDALAGLGGRDDWDALLVLDTALLGNLDAELPPVIAAAAEQEERPVLAVLPGLVGVDPALSRSGEPGRGVPAFATASQALAALGGAVAHARWLATDPGAILEPATTGAARARQLLTPLMRSMPAGHTERLDDATTAALLACYGIELLPSRAVDDEDGAVAAADELGWPVALKTRDEVLRHRADLGGVRLGLRNPDELRIALRAMTAEIAAVPRVPQGFDVQVMAPTGVACVLRGAEDDLYGPVVSFGLGGDAVELLGDIAYRIPPLRERDVTEMVRSVRAAPRLLGHRGLPVLDVAALEDVIARLGELTDDLPEVRSLTINPVLVSRGGARVLAATAEVAHPLRTDSSRRALPANPASGAKMEQWPTET